MYSVHMTHIKNFPIHKVFYLKITSIQYTSHISKISQSTKFFIQKLIFVSFFGQTSTWSKLYKCKYAYFGLIMWKSGVCVAKILWCLICCGENYYQLVSVYAWLWNSNNYWYWYLLLIYIIPVCTDWSLPFSQQGNFRHWIHIQASWRHNRCIQNPVANLVVKSKLPPRSGTSLEAVEPYT